MLARLLPYPRAKVGRGHATSSHNTSVARIVKDVHARSKEHEDFCEAKAKILCCSLLRITKGATSQGYHTIGAQFSGGIDVIHVSVAIVMAVLLFFFFVRSGETLAAAAALGSLNKLSMRNGNQKDAFCALRMRAHTHTQSLPKKGGEARLVSACTAPQGRA